MPLVFAGACSHAPGITARASRIDPAAGARLNKAYGRLRQALEASRPDVLVVIAAEHLSNFFMNNMPAFAMGMAEYYEGPVEAEMWLNIKRVRVPGDSDFARRLIDSMMHKVDLSYSQEWQLDHGIMVPLNFLTPSYELPIVPININCQHPPLPPLGRVWAFGEALRRGCDQATERIAVVATGGISHWPASPRSGEINVDWDMEFLERWRRNDRMALTAYSDDDTYLHAGDGGFEIRTYIAIAAATRGGLGDVWYYEPIPIVAVGCTVAAMAVNV